ncbi:uncharacterized protein [Mytilus edulis]|uniref:uncharacterized protein n=1 Tax=Mytilus edulis TaxID=6550 RepID=UPI0039EE6B68
MMTYPCINKFCHGTEHCHLSRHDHNIVSSCNTHRVLNSNEYCVNHDSINRHGCYCDTADCVKKTALHCLNVTCHPSQGCEIYRDNGQFAARCYSLDHCHGDTCIHRCNEPLKLDDQRGPCYCDSQACADRIEMPIVTTHAPTTDVPALQQLDPYSCVSANCDKYEPFCNLFEINNNVEGRCIIFQVGQLCSPFNDLSVHGGCSCTDSKCVSNAISHYNQKHTTATTLAPGYMCNKELCRSDMYCHIVNYHGVATSRCLVFNANNPCQSYTDVEGDGCICDNTNCSINILNEFSLHNPETTTTTSTTTQSTTPTTAVTTPTTTTTTTISTPTPTTTPTTTKTPITTTTTTIHTTTPTTTPTTTISTTTPTTTTPTTSTLTTTTPTTTPTTIISSTTTTVTGTRTCHICGDMTIQVPCSGIEIGRDLPQTCKTGEDYCMTDIVQDAQGNMDVFKRCVDLATCENKWKIESAGLNYCKPSGLVQNPHAYSCHFCCTQDKCNSMLVPNATTWYTKTN